MNTRISRRTVLRGVGRGGGAAMLGGDDAPHGRADPQSNGLLRMAFVYVPNGKHMPDWTPRAEGDQSRVAVVSKPLGRLRNNLLVLRG